MAMDFTRSNRFIGPDRSRGFNHRIPRYFNGCESDGVALRGPLDSDVMPSMTSHTVLRVDRVDLFIGVVNQNILPKLSFDTLCSAFSVTFDCTFFGATAIGNPACPEPFSSGRPRWQQCEICCGLTRLSSQIVA